MGCTFCATGTLGKIANLTDAEIVEQVHHARERDPNVTGVVFMGMGGAYLTNVELLIGGEGRSRIYA